MTEWQTDNRRGLSIGFSLMAAVVLIDVDLIWLATTRPLGSGTFIIGLAVLLSLILLGLVGYWLYGLARSGYTLDRNALIIHWGPTQQIIPTTQIKRALKGDEVAGHVQFHGVMWPGHWVGYGEVPGMGSAFFYATVPPREQVYIVTPGLTYGISPTDPQRFLDSLRQRLQMGPTQIVEQSSKRPGFLNWPLWRDTMGLALLAAGFLAILALTGLLCFRFPALSRLVPLHFNVAGTPDRLGPRGQIFFIPFIGLLALVLNGVLGGLAYRYERMASYLLWSGAVLTQVLVWIAAVGILGRM